ncbi:hypothetical protein Fmac_008940 [Flemingia macrophylla]|uniref:Uncharacterized protein n=1 Tax=Flemingia macrophylla TaxID=520843 RepID=A0ABD1N194_9FABA
MIESRVFEEVMEPLRGEDHHRVGKGHGFTSTTINVGVIEVFKEICKKNKDNRNKQVIPHTGGSKPISRRRHEMWKQKYTNLESQVQTTLGALKAYMIMKEGKIHDELVVFFDPQPQLISFFTYLAHNFEDKCTSRLEFDRCRVGVLTRTFRKDPHILGSTTHVPPSSPSFTSSLVPASIPSSLTSSTPSTAASSTFASASTTSSSLATPSLASPITTASLVHFLIFDLDAFAYHVLLDSFVDQNYLNTFDIIVRQIPHRGFHTHFTNVIIIKHLCKLRAEARGG